MNDPQVWTLIGVFAAATFGGITLLTTQLNRTIAAGFKAVDARFETVDARFDAVETTMNAKFDAVHVKLEHLDRDVSALSKHVFGIDRTDT